jgi:hypothetical protein
MLTALMLPIWLIVVLYFTYLVMEWILDHWDTN